GHGIVDTRHKSCLKLSVMRSTAMPSHLGLWLVLRIVGAFLLASSRPIADAATGFYLEAPAELPLVILEAKGRIASEPKIPCTLKVLAPKGSEAREIGPLPATVRFHGASSQMYPKKSFGLTLDAPARLLDLRESPHWVLNAA